MTLLAEVINDLKWRCNNIPTYNKIKKDSISIAVKIDGRMNG